ncbi:hypothetical protein GALL_406670 [mine drainage metagenome]|uniref:Uncharacterized protein n=1 Tax=mine drainage metagenome TaxID=410659 RepID=A0A1J5QCC3_9ZZZZ
MSNANDSIPPEVLSHLLVRRVGRSYTTEDGVQGVRFSRAVEGEAFAGLLACQ